MKPFNKTSLIWSAPIFGPSGYAEDARNLILGAHSVGIPVRAVDFRWTKGQITLDPRTDAIMHELLQTNLIGDTWAIWHCEPNLYTKAAGPKKNIGRATFETQGIPEIWVAKCNAMDEIWVPSRFNLESFARSGVHQEKLRILPEALNQHLYAQVPAPLPFRDGLGFVFLSTFTWQYRKGWDLLLAAYCREFKASENVCLVLKTYSLRKSMEEIQAEVTNFIREHLEMDLSAAPKILFFDEMISAQDMPRLYCSADVFVLPTRGEGWGRPFMESMAAGVPVIGTNFGGQLDYMHAGNSLLIDCSILPVAESAVKEDSVFSNQQWAEPHVEHIRELMRKAFVEKESIKKIGARARTEILSNYTQERVGACMQAFI